MSLLNEINAVRTTVQGLIALVEQELDDTGGKQAELYDECKAELDTADAALEDAAVAAQQAETASDEDEGDEEEAVG